MTVPFVDLGPGQVGRLAWQVLGKDGPIANPSGIRYLPPDSIAGETLSLSGAESASTALAGVNLLLSAGTLTLAAATLAEVRRLSEKMDALEAGQAAMNSKLDAVIARLKIIEVKVSEGRLATLVDHAIRASARGSDEISFAPFADLAGDLESFVADCGIVCGAPPQVRLGSDVRAALHRVWCLLRGCRLQTAHLYNRRAMTPDDVWACDPANDYWPESEQTLAIMTDLMCVAQANALDIASFHAHHAVNDCFSLNGYSDHVVLQEALNRGVSRALVACGVDEDDAVSVPARVLARFNAQPSASIPYLEQSHSDAYAREMVQEMREAVARARRTYCYPPAVIDLAMEDEQEDLFDAWRSHWLYGTDAGLVYRALAECRGIRDGYRTVFESSKVVREGHREPTGYWPTVVASLSLPHEV